MSTNLEKAKQTKAGSASGNPNLETGMQRVPLRSVTYPLNYSNPIQFSLTYSTGGCKP